MLQMPLRDAINAGVIKQHMLLENEHCWAGGDEGSPCAAPISIPIQEQGLRGSCGTQMGRSFPSPPLLHTLLSSKQCGEKPCREICWNPSHSCRGWSNVPVSPREQEWLCCYSRRHSRVLKAHLPVGRHVYFLCPLLGMNPGRQVYSTSSPTSYTFLSTLRVANSTSGGLGHTGGKEFTRDWGENWSCFYFSAWSRGFSSVRSYSISLPWAVLLYSWGSWWLP